MKKRRFLIILNVLLLVIIPAYAGNASEFRFEGVHFSYDRSLASDVNGERVPAEPITHGPPKLETGSPEHIRVSFDHDTAPGIFDPHDAQFLIFPVEDYRMIFEVIVNTIDTLQTLLTDKPEAIEEEFPFLPPMSASQVFGVQMKYLDFQNGTGVRYITYYSQDVTEITNQDIFYTYQGLTADRKYYVSFVFPVSVSVLPDQVDPDLDQEVFANTYNEYLAKTSASLNKVFAKDYSPNLVVLDAMIESLVVEPKNLGQ